MVKNDRKREMRIKRHLVASIILCFSQVVSAEIVQGDWRSNGDGLAFVNTKDGTEWLSVTSTMGWSLAKLQSEIQDGGVLEGWRIPNQSELESVLNAIMPRVKPENMYVKPWSGLQVEEWNALRDLFWDGDRSTSYAYGWTQYDGGSDFYRTGTANQELWSGIGVKAKHWGSLGGGSRADTGFFLVGNGSTSLVGQANASNVPSPFLGALVILFVLGKRRCNSYKIRP